MIKSEVEALGNCPDLLHKRLAHRLILGGIESRATDRCLTGDWLIFAKVEGVNFYLSLANHEEGHRDPKGLLHRLREGCHWEFPHVWDVNGVGT